MPKFSLFKNAFLFGLTMFIVASAIGLAAFAVLLLLARIMPLWGAALTTGGILFLFVLLAVAVRWCWRRYRRGFVKRHAPRWQHDADLLHLIDPAVLELIRSKPRSAMFVALLAGTALGASPELRRVVGRFLKNVGADRDSTGQ